MIGTDLIRNMYMYELPYEIELELEKEYGEIIYIDPTDLNSYKSQGKEVEIYLGDRIRTDMLDYFPNLKWIHLTCVGFDKLLGIEKLNKNIVVTNSKGVLTESMVSTIVSMMFGLARIQPQCNDLVRSNNFNREVVNHIYFDYIQDVFGQNCAIVGYGEVGRKLEEVLKPFNMKFYNINRTTTKWKMEDLEEVVSKSDYVINLLPYTHQTKNVFNKYIFKSMKNTAYFINIGRGKTVVEEDLTDALIDEEIAGAGLDVFKEEPLSKNSELTKLNNVILSPHISSYSPSYWDREYELFKNNLLCYKNKTKLKNIVYEKS